MEWSSLVMKEESRVRFHKRFITSNFYKRRSQKDSVDLIWFFAFVKAAGKHVGEIDPRS